MNYRRTCMLRRRLDQGEVDLRHLDLKQQRDLQTLEDGSLLQTAKQAVAAYAHGTLRHGDESIEIGGSTGGVTRLLLDGYAEPDAYSFLARR